MGIPENISSQAAALVKLRADLKQIYTDEESDGSNAEVITRQLKRAESREFLQRNDGGSNDHDGIRMILDGKEGKKFADQYTIKENSLIHIKRERTWLCQDLDDVFDTFFNSAISLVGKFFKDDEKKAWKTIVRQTEISGAKSVAK